MVGGERKRVMAGFVALVVVLALGAFAPKAEALTFSLDQVFSGFTPPGGPTYVTVTVTDNGSGGVTLTMTASSIGSAFVGDVYLNYNSTTIPATSAFTHSSAAGDVNGTVEAGSNCCKADGDGLYDIHFSFAANALNNGLSSTWTVAGVSAANFNALSCESPDCTNAGSAGPFHAAAHIQGITNSVPGGATCSGWVGDSAAGGANATLSGTCGASVAEPSVLLFAGLGLAFVGGLWRRMQPGSARPV